MKMSASRRASQASHAAHASRGALGALTLLAGAAALLVGTPGTAHAQPASAAGVPASAPEAKADVELGAVNVSGDWLGTGLDNSAKTFPGARTVVKKQDIEASGAASIGDVMRRIPGVQSTDNSSTAGSAISLNIGVRGLTGRFSPRSTGLLDGIPLGPDGWHAYFLHGYHLVAEKPEDVIAVADYGGPVTSIVATGTVAGTQFHPEKSQRLGLKLLENFLAWTP